MDMKTYGISQKHTKRAAYLDLLRIIAIVLVMFYHTGYKGFSFFTSAEDSVLFPLYLFCAIFSRIAVPLFFMVSGALLLKKDEIIPVILKKRFLKFFVVLVLASFVIYLEEHRFSGFSLKEFAAMVYSTKTTTHLWYLYTYLGFILSLPFLRSMVRSMRPVHYMYLTGIALLFSGLEIFDYLFSGNEMCYNGDFQVPFTWTMLYYPLMGDFLANKLPMEKVTGKKMVGVAALGVAGIAVSGWLTWDLYEAAGDWNAIYLEQFFATLIYLPTCATFLGIRFLDEKLGLFGKAEKVIIFVGSCTFGIYLFEPLYRGYTSFVYDWLIQYIPCYGACAAWLICAMLLGLAVTGILKKTPGIQKLI